MNPLRMGAIAFLALLAALCLCAQAFAPSSYTQQFRDLPDAAPSAQHWLGTDELGRDRWARLLSGTRVSLLLAPAAALLATGLAALIGGAAGLAGRWTRRAVMAATDLFLSLPWLFLLIAVRALLPLDVSPFTSAAVTFALLGSLGWAAAARVVCADAAAARDSDFILLARASGAGRWRLLRRHILPNLKPVLLAQFWVSVPIFILAEANLGMLGLGVAEPLPSWGGLLRELEGFSAISAHWWQFAPLVLLVLTVGCFHLALQAQEPSA
jgi:ABC-type dipeptide/oligopeptide/nickel transport system permease subunit